MERKAIRIYWFASFLAVIEAYVLFILGLDLRFEQARLFFIFGFPAPLIMLLCDHWLIIRHVRPIDAVLKAQTTGHTVTPDDVHMAYLQTLNLPVLTLLRVLTIHAPSVLIPLTLLCLLANHVAGLGLAWWQFFVLWSFWPITSVPHAIVEAFLIDRAGRQLLKRLERLNNGPITAAAPHASFTAALRLLFGLRLAAPHLIRTSTGVQLSWFVFFVSLMPMFTLGASVYLKMAAFNPEATRAQLLGAVGPWITLLVLFNAAISIAIVTLMSRRVHSSMQELLGKMQRVLRGDLSQPWSPHTTDEFFDLGAGFNAMLLGLRERETIKDTFGRFVSQEVATAVLEGRVPLRGAPGRRGR